MFYFKPLSEKLLHHLRRKTQTVLSSLLEEKNIGEKSNRLAIPRSAPIFHDSLQITVPIGKAKVNGIRRDFVIKLNRIPRPPSEIDATHFVLSHYMGSQNREETYAKYFKKLGLPVTAHHTIGEVAPGIVGTVTFNLQPKGKKLEEVDGFDFSKLKNGSELKAEFGKYARLLRRKLVEDEIAIDRHADPVQVDKPFEHAFFVQHDGKTGKLLMGDIDHIMLTEKTFTKYPDLAEHVDKIARDQLNALKRNKVGKRFVKIKR